MESTPAQPRQPRQRSQRDPLPRDIGQRIRAARQERGMSLAQVGGDDLTRSFLSLVELGRSRISLRALAIVAERLELPISYFLGDISASQAEIVEFTLDHAEVALARGKPGECLHAIEDVEVPDSLRARSLWLRGQALIELGRAREALGLLQEGAELAERRGDPDLQVRILYHVGTALYTLGNYDEALTTLRRALTITVDGPADPALLGKITIYIGHILYLRNNLD